MTSTRLAPAFLFCKCGHTGRRHEVVDGGEHEGACTASGCPCAAFAEENKPLEVADVDAHVIAPGRIGPPTSVVGEREGPPELVIERTGGHPANVPVVQSPEIRDTNHPPMLTRAARSPNAKTRKLGAKVEQMLADLAGILDHEAKSEAARRRLAALDDERERLLAELGLATRMPRSATPVQCICGRPFGSAQACGVHAARQRERGDDNHGQRPEPEHGVA